MLLSTSHFEKLKPNNIHISLACTLELFVVLITNMALVLDLLYTKVALCSPSAFKELEKLK